MINDKPPSITVKQALRPVVGTTDAVKPEVSGNNSVSENSRMTEQASTESKALPGSSVAVNALTDKESATPPAQSFQEIRQEELKEKVSEAIPKVRELLQKNQRSLDFKVAEKENRIIITVIDKETDKVIRQIPPEDFLNIADSFFSADQGMGAGIILDSKA